MKLAGKVALVTGGGSGLGRETCFLFASEGAKVIVADYIEDSAKRVANEIQREGGSSYYVKVDVSNRNEVEAAIESIVQQYDRIDILVNNAGITADAKLLNMTEEQWNRVISVNQTGVFNCGQIVAAYMVKQGSGRIINTSSIVGRLGNFGQTNYAAAKAAVIAMTQTWAKELGRKGINVNAVAPGFILTSMTEKMPDKVLSMMKDKIPLQRLGVPSDVAKAYLFLASDDAAYVNGTVIAVDGGLVI
ncbi:3-oxoacyl-ACP reductase FabG [Anaerobacillus sp. MEB173]|uniref:3-oxoacyl-ACP reductase FabG n=1 Tax=Anaerobacillus sp. MEB173 TaxID=3383345 RepID=UPI003F93C1D4